uniref:Uncharacterized protein n=1 Tax=Romanomermis culicivorax TaxID=13658 RepID=A0A915JQD4_ROMCU
MRTKTLQTRFTQPEERECPKRFYVLQKPAKPTVVEQHNLANEATNIVEHIPVAPFTPLNFIFLRTCSACFNTNKKSSAHNAALLPTKNNREKS